MFSISRKRVIDAAAGISQFCVLREERTLREVFVIY